MIDLNHWKLYVYCCHLDRLTLTGLSVLGDHLAVATVAVTSVGAIAVYTVALSFTWLIVTLIHIYNGRQGRKVEEIKWNTTPQPNFARRDCSLSNPWLRSFLTVQSFLSDGPEPNWGRARLQPRPLQWGKGSRRGSSLDSLFAVVRHCGAGQHKQTDPFHFGLLHFSRLLCNVWWLRRKDDGQSCWDQEFACCFLVRVPLLLLTPIYVLSHCSLPMQLVCSALSLNPGSQWQV